VAENFHPLTQADINRLGRLAALHVEALPDNFDGGSNPEIIEQIVVDLGMEAIAMTFQKPPVPEEVDPDDSF